MINDVVLKLSGINMTNSTEIAVKSVILASAPERNVELLKMWEDFQPNFQMANDKPGFTLEAGSFGLIIFDHKTMCQIWLLGFSAQHTFNLYLTDLYFYQATQLLFSPTQIFTNEVEAKVTEVYGLIEELREHESIDSFEWPSNIPSPYNGKPQDVNGSMVFDLLCIASAYCFLHEFRHVQIRKSEISLDIHDEEYQCDKFARDFLISQIGEYAENSGYDTNTLKNKRLMAIALAAVLLFVITPEDLWDGSETHPPVANRIEELTKNVTIGDNDYFWAYLSSLLLSLLLTKKKSIPSTQIYSQRNYCMNLLSLF